jgi:hypothetical protein
MSCAAARIGTTPGFACVTTYPMCSTRDSRSRCCQTSWRPQTCSRQPPAPSRQVTCLAHTTRQAHVRHTTVHGEPHHGAVLALACPLLAPARPLLQHCSFPSIINQCYICSNEIHRRIHASHSPNIAWSGSCDLFWPRALLSLQDRVGRSVQRVRQLLSST